ncbi:Ig-like domain-containing protein [Flavobacterium panacagri]|uniref:Ig-like domain-containing protein n=1 Tax=Flavobacterium panacagri TaxID=3034146 RepID=UPI0025A632A3|nr:Ig-like domain-containing protein [Flavobacterium panacagri]
MKKTLLLFLFLLPFLGIAQSDLVTWDNAHSLDAHVLASPSQVASSPMTGSNLQIIDYVGFSGSHWPAGSFYDPSKYIQISIKAQTGYKIDLSSLKYAYYPYDGGQGCRKYQVRYSKNSSFPSGGTLLLDNQNPSLSGKNNVTLNFPVGVTLLPEETLYIRFYGYDVGNVSWQDSRWGLVNLSTYEGGTYNLPTIRGTALVYNPTLTANNDTGTSVQNNFTVVNVLANDLQATNPINSVTIQSQSANGTAVVTSDNRIKFTPATGFTGATSFTYTIGDGTSTSTATVNITVTAPSIDDLVKWNGPDSGAPTIMAPTTAVAGDPMTPGSGSILEFPANEGFKGYQWPTQFSIDESKYFQVTTSALTGYKIKLDKFNFTYTPDSNHYVARYQVRYSKDNFATSFLLLDEATSTGTTNKSLDLSNITLYPNEKITLRIYGYKLKPNSFDGSPIFLANINTKGSGTTPTIRGTVLNYDPTDLNANDDLISTQEKRAVAFNALTNDTNTSGAVITFTQPAASTGTVSLNGNIFTFTPAATFKGTTSFTYTLTNGTKSSTATVSVYVTDLSPKLIIWNGAVQTPKAVVTDPNITGNDLTISPQVNGSGFNMGIYDNYFNITNVQNNGSTTLDLNRYVQMSVTPKANYKLTLTQFNFIYNSPVGNGNEGASKYEVHYSTDPTFPNGGTVLLGATTAVRGADTPVTLNFPSGTTVSSSTNQTFYIRIYPYAVADLYNGYFKIKNDYGGDVGPTLSGVVEPSNSITAVADFANTGSNTAVVIPVLSNDSNYTPLASITATQPASGGTVQVNGTTNITFTPTAGFIGTSTFEYTIFNGLNYSTATVTVNVTCQTPGDQLAFGQNQWIGYVYKLANNAQMPPNTSYPGLPSASVGTYIGTVTENQNFDRNVGNGAVSGATVNFGCETAPTDRFLVRYKMKATITEAGLYNFDLGSDDGIRLYIDNAAAPLITRWNGHGYTTDYATQNLTAGEHEFVLEYYEDGGASRVSFFFGLPKGNPTEYGDKVWNVYGYVNNDITLANVRYAGYYVDPNLNPYSTSYWTRDKSPSSATIWQGSQIPNDNFTVVYKRKGFDCGRYLLQHNNHDDAIEIYIDNQLIFSANGWNNASFPINSGKLYALNSNSLVEIRLREDGGDANLGINFVKTNVTYTNGQGDEAGSNLVVNGSSTLSSDLTVCSCTVNPNTTLTVPKDITLTVDEAITVGTGGKLLILDGGSFLQTSTSETMFTGDVTSAFEIQRKISVRRYDLTYWSMPVTHPGFNMHQLSPDTLGDKYYYYDPSGGWTIDYNGITPMQRGKGYSVRAPQSYDINNKTDFLGVFTGTPNNGDISAPVVSGKWNLIGNPYPSAIDADQFLDDNLGVGSLYFWAHVNLPIKSTTDQYLYYKDDFVVYNSLGGTTTGDSNAFKGSIASAQGFIVKAPTATINFNNGQRQKAKNTQFYKTAKSSIERNRVWLNFTNSAGTFKQILVGYATGATNTTDVNFDAVSMGSNPDVDFYSINNSKKLSIQGRALPFVNSDLVPLGYMLAAAGDYTISIDHADGFFNTGQDIFLEDKTTGKITNLRLANYTFNSAAGTFNSRFVIRYTNSTLGTDDFESAENGLFVSVKSKVINVNSSTENISEVQIYNIGGQSLYTKNKIDSKELQISNLQSSNQVLLVKVTLENGAVVTKKIIFN